MLRFFDTTNQLGEIQAFVERGSWEARLNLENTSNAKRPQPSAKAVFSNGPALKVLGS
jgi:hypothetical protein